MFGTVFLGPWPEVPEMGQNELGRTTLSQSN